MRVCYILIYKKEIFFVFLFPEKFNLQKEIQVERCLLIRNNLFWSIFLEKAYFHERKLV